MTLLRAVLTAAPATRRPLGWAMAATVVTAITSVLAAEALARTVLAPTPTMLAVLAAALVLRALAAAGRDGAAESAAAVAVAQVRATMLTTIAQRAAHPGDPARAAGADAARIGAGTDGVRQGVAIALPRAATAAVLPLLVLVRVATLDPRSALTLILALALVPVFMILVGRHTGEQTRERLEELTRLGAVFTDVLRALPGLRALGRAGDQVTVARHWAHQYRRASMAVLRTAFLSALVLELLASVCLAVLAVPIGLRLLDGAMTPTAALVVLLLVPEAFAALRSAGAAAHESAAGLAVLDRLDATPPPPRAAPALQVAPDPSGAVIELVDIHAGWEPGRPVLAGFSLRLQPGTCTALLGPSGSGKSTVIAILLGLLVPERGQVLIDGAPLADARDPRWRAHLGWAPQAPQLTGTTIAQALRLGDPGADDSRLWAALVAAAADDVVAAAGLEAPLRDGAAGLSVGERHRLALARALLPGAALLLLDEPSAHVDQATEARILARRPAGATMLIATHRQAVAAHADHVITLPPATT